MYVVEEMSLALSFLFSRIHPKLVLVKLQSRTLQPLDRSEIWTPPLEPIFTHYHRWKCEIMFLQREISLKR